MNLFSLKKLKMSDVMTSGERGIVQTPSELCSDIMPPAKLSEQVIEGLMPEMFSILKLFVRSLFSKQLRKIHFGYKMVEREAFKISLCYYLIRKLRCFMINIGLSSCACASNQMTRARMDLITDVAHAVGKIFLAYKYRLATVSRLTLVSVHSCQ